MRERLRNEDGVALVMALGITVVLIIFVTSMIGYTTSSQRGANISSADLTARQYAEAGLNSAYSLLVNQNTVTGGNPTAANLLGCTGSGGSGTLGPSSCSDPSPKVVCLTTATCTSGSPGSARVFGFFSGTNQATYTDGTVVNPSTWLLISTGFARNPDGATTARTTTATIHISSLDNGAVASVWNHIFMTKPLVPNVCQASFNGNNTLVTSPLYVVGNLCLSGQNVALQQATGGQAIDLMVGGVLALSGSGSKVGADSSHPIYSGVVQGGCTTAATPTATGACASGSFNYWVGTTDTWVAAKAPAVVSGDIAADYAAFDPGPSHQCATGGLPAGTWDNNAPLQDDSLPAAFELVPTSSYTCISQSGASAGQLTWNNSTKQLTINGNVFIDGNLTISQSATYTGTGVIEAAGTITFNGNATQLCATATTPCDFTNWQGASSNHSMLTLVALAQNTTSVTFTNNSQTFQGSLWTDPSSIMTFVKNGVTIEGPISIGGFDATFNNASFKPLPLITNMPTGAPLPPNTGASIDALTITK